MITFYKKITSLFTKKLLFNLLNLLINDDIFKSFSDKFYRLILFTIYYIIKRKFRSMKFLRIYILLLSESLRVYDIFKINKINEEFY